MTDHNKNSKSNYIYLDIIRGVAALLVLVNHARGLFFVDYKEIINPNLISKVAYFLTSLGHQSVVVFFVLSGFLISTSIFRSLETNRWSWKRYFINRLTRLYIVLIPALLLGAFWDNVGVLIFGKGSIYSGNFIGNNIITFQVFPRLSFSVFIGNLFFLQEILTNPFGSNGALWSLSYEFWYYIIFPVLLHTFIPNKKKIKILYFVLSCVLFVFVGKKISIYFSVWLLGVFVGRLFKRETLILSSKKSRLISFFIFIGTLFFVRWYSNPGFPDFISDFALGITFSFFIFTLRYINLPSHSLLFNKFSKVISGFSYTLYLVHLPLLLFIHELVTPGMRWQPNSWSFTIISLFTGMVLSYAYIISRFTEAKTDKFRAFFSSRTIHVLSKVISNSLNTNRDI